MGRQLSITSATLIVAGAWLAGISTAASTPRPALLTKASADATVEFGNWNYDQRERNSAFSIDWNDSRRYRRRDRDRYVSRYRSRPSYFGFPFASRPLFYPYPSRGDCFRTWDGQVICR
jgi:hypothetical protein